MVLTLTLKATTESMYYTWQFKVTSPSHYTISNRKVLTYIKETIVVTLRSTGQPTRRMKSRCSTS